MTHLLNLSLISDVSDGGLFGNIHLMAPDGLFNAFLQNRSGTTQQPDFLPGENRHLTYSLLLNANSSTPLYTSSHTPR